MRSFARALLFSLPVALVACSVGPDYVTPSSPPPGPTYKDTGDWKPAQPKDDMIRGKWWELYHDPALNALEEQVNISNQNVLMAEAQFREASAATKVARAAFFPTITARPSFTESKGSSGRGGGSSTGSVISDGTSGTGVGVGTGTTTGATGSASTVVLTGSGSGGSSLVSEYDLPLEATYLVDVWGSVRRNVEANSTTAQASFADLENARLSYQAMLAQDYFSLHGLDAQEEILRETVAAYRTNVQLTTNRYNSGIASKGDIALAQTQLDTTRAQLIDVGVQRAVYEHAIAVLIGQPATLFSLKQVSLKSTPPRIPFGVPSTLLERRPDIAGAERRVASANASIGEAVAAYFPQLTLTASTGADAVKFSDLFSGPSFLWSVGPTIAQTVFDAGKTHGEVQEARANYDVTVATYRETVLTAFQQVEDDLSGLQILQEEAGAEDQAVKSAQESLDISVNAYKAGTEDYLNVITNQTTALSDQLSALSIRTRRMTTSVLLIEAVGGGWDTSRLPGKAGVADVPEADASISKGKQ